MSNNETKNKKGLYYLIVYLVIVIIVFIAGLFTASIIERRVEYTSKLEVVKEIADFEPRNEVWGANYPRQFESYKRTMDTNFRSKYGGSGKIDYLELYPELVVLWAGYPFSKEYNQGRGHAHAIEDIRAILRTGDANDSPMPATCWACKSPDVPRMMQKIGPTEFYKQKWINMGEEIVNPIGCQDCHDPKTMNLRITRPALIEAMNRRGKKVEDFTHQEMRSLVCAQCHVEYYFKGEGKYLTFPWDKGFSADSMEAYYDEIAFKDWQNSLSNTPMLKAQHPDYELFMTGIHAIRGVACADCHMPYKVDGGVKFSDHHVQSPLNNIANSCQVCHRESEEQLRNDVYDRQDRVTEIRRIAEKAICAAHLETQIAIQAGIDNKELIDVQTLIRHAQWRWDWVAAANSVGFHSPVEVLRVLGTSIERAEKARGLLSVIFVRHNINIPVKLPDLATKSIAQKYIGWNMDMLNKNKEQFMNTIVPKWDENAKKRQGTLIKY